MTEKPEVDLAELRQITAWLADAEIGFIEVRKPGTTLRLKLAGDIRRERRRDERDTERSPRATNGQQRAAALPTAAAAIAVNVTAGSAGIFLAVHPARELPFVEIGARVTPGEVIGLLRIAQLCLPVIASSAGVVRQRLVAHGTTVGYGTPLFEIAPAP